MFGLSATALFLIRKFLFFCKSVYSKQEAEKKREERKREEKNRKENDTKVFGMESLGRYNIQKLGNSYDNT